MSSIFTQYPAKGGVATYANFAAFPAIATNGTLAVALDTGYLYEYNANTPGWQLIGPGGGSGTVGSNGSVGGAAGGTGGTTQTNTSGTGSATGGGGGSAGVGCSYTVVPQVPLFAAPPADIVSQVYALPPRSTTLDAQLLPGAEVNIHENSFQRILCSLSSATTVRTDLHHSMCWSVIATRRHCRKRAAALCRFKAPAVSLV